MAEFFVDLILPLPLKGVFTYQVSEAEYNSLQKGCRVAVAFGKTKIYTGLVYQLHQQKPTLYKAKPIQQIIDEFPIVLETQIQLWEWISAYYCCSIGEVYRQALPAAFNLNSETFIKKNKFAEFTEEDELSDDEQLILNIFENKSSLSVEELSAYVDTPKVLLFVKKMLDKGLIILDEEIKQKYIPKIENYVRFNPELKADTEAFSQAFVGLEKAPKQKEIFMHLLSLEGAGKPIKTTTLIQESGATHASLKTMVDKGILEVYQLQTDRTFVEDTETEIIYELSEAQQVACQSIEKQFTTHDIVLFQGVTGSGKTEVYIQLIQEVLAEGKKVLFLLPEIALTTQLIHRLRRFFGNKVGYFHSKFNENEKVELWLKTLYNQYDIVIGARSALFLPMQDLGLIIIDEEHEVSFKQAEPAPRFHARDTAMVWAKIQQAKTLLGSATPSLESYYNAKKGKYGFTQLNKRYGNIQMPEIQLVDLKEAYKNKEMQGDFSDILVKNIQETLDNHKQVIIFQNRRGYAPVVECQSCGHTPHCPNCDVALTFHQQSRTLKCHYCGHSQAQPKFCPSCKSTHLDTKGIGTEQVEQQLIQLFPNYKIQRMDADTMRGKYAYEKLIRQFEAKEIDILVGTQMVAKGLDFNDVGLVGVLKVDTMLNFQDFRAHERTFQMMTQVAGRAGRKNERGKVLIQSFIPEHNILQQISTYDYELMAKETLYQRKQFMYPPFNRLIVIELKYKDKNKLTQAAEVLAEQLRKSFGANLLGPESPSIERIRNLYYKQILLKINDVKKTKVAKHHIEEVIQNFQSLGTFRNIRVIINVDPY